MDLKDKVAVITGAARGIGRATALMMAEYGADIAILDVLTDLANNTAEEVQKIGRKGVAYTCDVGQYQAVVDAGKKILAEFGTVDILVNNAGITRDKLFLKMSEQDWDDVIQTNLKGAFNCCKVFAPIMREKKYGRIINLSSVVVRGNIGQTNYSASKAAIVGLTKTLAKELPFGGCDITVNAIQPGMIWTDMLKAVPDKILTKFKAETPLGRVGQPKEVAALICFLASDLASYITGAEILVSGGKDI
ncbi:MAG: beta-ketoacyl-ACP reductase [Candidatus Helarchaeota archaeon]